MLEMPKCRTWHFCPIQVVLQDCPKEWSWCTTICAPNCFSTTSKEYAPLWTLQVHISYNLTNYHTFRFSAETYQDVVPGILPFFHIYGMMVILINSLYMGCKVVSLSSFSPELFIKTLIGHKPTVMYVVPPIGKNLKLQRYFKVWSGFDLVNFMSMHPSVKEEYIGSIHTLISGAAPLGALDEEKFMKKTNNKCRLTQGKWLPTFPNNL